MRTFARFLGSICALGMVVAVGARDAQVYKPGDGVTLPRLIREVKPNYPQAAKDAKIQGSVTVSAVVLEDGKVGEVTVTRSLDTKYGLDEEAVKCVKKWLFTPGTKDGKPVAVLVEIEIAFTLP
jgi:periplasmic protein TonB